MKTTYMVVVTERPPRQGLAAAVGPFAEHYLAFEWGDANVKGHGWQVVPVATRTAAKRTFKRARPRKAVTA